jgi:hypothetical protein
MFLELFVYLLLGEGMKIFFFFFFWHFKIVGIKRRQLFMIDTNHFYERVFTTGNRYIYFYVIRACQGVKQLYAAKRVNCLVFGKNYV